jgi:hypothetical protein
MVQIGLSIMGLALIIGAVYALAGKEKPGKKTSPSVAVAMIVAGIVIIAFAFIGLPMLMSGI